MFSLEETAGLDQAAELRARACNIPLSIKEVIIDCSKVERLDCRTLQVLSSFQKELGQRDARLQFRDLDESISNFAKIAGLGALFEQQ